MPFSTRKMIQNADFEAFWEVSENEKEEKEKREEGDWRNVKNVDSVEGKRYF